VKMILAVLQDDDAERALPVLVERRIGVTRLATTGGFLRRGNTTLMLGVEDERVDEALEILRSALPASSADPPRRVTAFVLNVARFEQI
jgi:uncharacterized protein YaaQ